MKVKQLIKELKKMPQEAVVGIKLHDNSEYEIAGLVCTVSHKIKADFDPDDDPYTADIIDSNPDEWVVLGC